MMKNRILVAILPVLACFALLPGAQGQCLDGCDSNFGTFQGEGALISNSAGAGNAAFGWRSLFSNFDGSFNTGLGGGTLVLNNGSDNTAAGTAALLLNTTGTDNTAVGTDAMVFNDIANNGTAVGAFALTNNVSGDDNTAVGTDALQSNVLALTNAALGTFAAQNNDSSGAGLADFNTAVGGFALQANVDGTRNTAVGAGAMESADGGNDNTAIGELAGLSITGNSNTCLGHSTGSTLTSGEGNIYIGAQVQPGSPGEFEFIRIGDDTAFTFPYDTFIAGIFNRSVSTATAQFVFVDDTGKLGTILVDANGNKVATPQAMLDESLKQQKRIAELEGTVERLAAMVKEQTAQIQRVSAQLEVSKPAPQVVVNKP
jgi:hypothetical protein